MNITPLTEDPHLLNFFQLKNLRINTKKNYITALTSYTNFLINYKIEEWKTLGINVKEDISFIHTLSYLIEEADKEEEERIRLKHKKIKKYLVLYSNHLLKNYKSETIKSYLVNIKSFYKKFEINDLPELDLNLPKQNRLITYDDLLSLDDIRQIVNHCNIKYKAITLLMISSGMGSAEVRHLTYKDFLNAIGIKKYVPVTELEEYLTDFDCATWRIKRIKTDKEYVTFSSPESVYAIIDYLKIKNKGKHPITDMEYILFNHTGTVMSKHAIADYYSKINEKLDLGKLNDHNKLHAHGLRIWMATMTGKQGAQERTTGQFLGHMVKNITGHYVKTDIGALKNEYLRLLPYLSIEKLETVTIDSPDVREIKQHNKELSDTVEKLTERMSNMEREMFKAIKENESQIK